MRFLTRKNQIAISKHLAAICYTITHWDDEEWADFAESVIHNLVEIACIAGGDRMMSIDVPACIESLSKKVEDGKARQQRAKVMTNAERIRNMSDDDLAKFLLESDCGCPGGSWDSGDAKCWKSKQEGEDKCFACWLNWMQEEDDGE